MKNAIDLDDLETPTEEPKEMTDAQRGVLDQAKKRFKMADDMWSIDRAEALDDLKFYSGDQWDPKIKTDRENSDRPCLTVNMLPQFVFQVTNEQRQNKPGIKVRPFDSAADVKTAEKIQGLVRHIEQNSAADVAYDSAFDDAVKTGLGFFRIRTDYCNEKSFDQDIFIERIQNRFSVRCGPAKKPDYSDMRWAFVSEDMPREEFRDAFPSAQMVDWEQTGEGEADGWSDEDSVRVAEYWSIRETPTELFQLIYAAPPPPPDPGAGMELPGAVPTQPTRTQPPKELRLFKEELPEGKIPAGYRLAQRRKTSKRQVFWYKMTGAEILEEGEWAGRWIPIVPVIGIEQHIEGVTKYLGLVRNAKDPQAMYNYWWTAETEMIALAPKAPWVAAEGQISDSADPGAWEKANVENTPWLEYKPVTHGGQLAPPPQRQPFAGPPAGIVNARMSAREDMKSATGIYEAGLGQRSNETSGRAILARQSEGDVATYHYIDNLARAIRHAGRIVVDLIRKVYDAPRVGRILGENGDEELVLFNQEYQDEQTGETQLYDLSVGEYDVVVSLGPAFAAQRQEAAAIQQELVKANPKLLEIGGDIIMRNIDGPGMQELADRLERTIPPEILGKQPGDKDDQPAAAVLQQELMKAQTQLQQMTQAMEETQTALAEVQRKLEAQTDKLELDRELAYLKAETDMNIAKLKQTGDPDTLAAIDHLAGQLDWLRTNLAERELNDLEGPADPNHPGNAEFPPLPAPPIDDGTAPPSPEPGPIPGNEPPEIPNGDLPVPPEIPAE